MGATRCGNIEKKLCQSLVSFYSLRATVEGT